MLCIENSRSREQIEVANVKAANLYKSVQASGAVLCLGSALALPWQATSPYDAVGAGFEDAEQAADTVSHTFSISWHHMLCYR